MSKSYDKALATIKDHGVRFVNLWFTDVVGHVKTVTIPVSKFDEAVELQRSGRAGKIVLRRDHE